MLPVINALEVQKGRPAMKQNTTELENPRRRVVRKNKQRELTIGVDLGDKTSRYCVLDREGNVLFERSTATTKKGLAQAFASMGASRIAMEAHSPWVKRLLESWNHEVIVANAHRVRLITESTRKDDRLDARKLARLARVDPELLSPIRHRSEGGYHPPGLVTRTTLSSSALNSRPSSCADESSRHCRRLRRSRSAWTAAPSDLTDTDSGHRVFPIREIRFCVMQSSSIHPNVNRALDEVTLRGSLAPRPRWTGHV
jgi:hypothetical protein